MARGTTDERAEKFQELAAKRLQNALKAISLLGNLARKYDYEYSDDQVETIFHQLDQEIHTVKRRFHEESL